MKHKKGSHVGMIISFVIFITFIIFLYSITRPAVSIGQDKKTLADYLFLQIFENVSTNFTSTSLEIEDSFNPNSNCVTLQELLVVPELSPPFLKVKNEAGVIQESHSNYEAGLADVNIIRSNSGDRFFRIYHSRDFPILSDTGTAGCNIVRFDNYKISLVKTEKFPFLDKIDFLKNYYQNYYDKTKENLKVPPGTEFSFEFVQSNGTKIESGESPKTANVYATETPIQYIDNDANLLSGFINVRVW